MKKIYRKSFIAILLLTSVQLFAQLPTVEAPKPDYPAANVISLYSDEYTPVTTLSVLTWGQTSILNYVKVGAGEVMQLINLQWLPMGFQDWDVSMMQYVHIDVYCNIASPFRFGFVNWGMAGNPPYEVYTPYFNLTPGQWYSVDYPLSYFKDRDLNCKEIGAIRFGDDDGTVYSKEIYVDNIYFFEGTPKNPFIDTRVNEIKSESSFRIYPTIVTDKINCESQEAVKEVSISNVTGQILRVFKMNENKQELNLLNLNPGFYFVTSHFSDGKTLSKSIIKI